jgi:hypothetical protein
MGEEVAARMVAGAAPDLVCLSGDVAFERL